MAQSLAARILDALPQTQCARCGYPDCAAYAQAVADGTAAINQCPPGGAEGIARLAALTGQAALPLNPANGTEGPRATAVIDEAWCIGCALCLKACPTDAIVGANKLMHTVIEAHCTGCELCLPVCPVDCIDMVPLTGQLSALSGWAAWSQAQADAARRRYGAHQSRQKPPLSEPLASQASSSGPATDTTDSQAHQEQKLEHKRQAIAAALNRARLNRSQPG